MSFPALKLTNSISFTTTILPAIPQHEESFTFSTRKAYCNFASKQLKNSYFENLYSPLYFSCPSIATCNFRTSDPEKAHLHAGKHSVKCFYRGTEHDWSFIYEAQQDQPKLRLVNRQHLFSGRLFTLAKQGSKPVPVFEKAGKYVRVTYTFGATPTTLIFSRSDLWTNAYLEKLKPFQTRFIAQGSFINNFNVVSFGPTKSLTSLLLNAGLFSGPILGNLVVLCHAKERFIAVSAILNIVAMTGSLFADYAQVYKETSTLSFFGQSNFSWVPSAASIIMLMMFGTGKALESHIPSVMSRALTLGTTLAGLNSISTILQRSWTELFPFLYEKYYGVPFILDECFTASSQFKSLVERMRDFEAEKGPDRLPTSKHHCEVVFRMADELQKLYIDADIRKIKTFSPAVKFVERTLERWSAAARGSAHGSLQPRLEPVLIQLYGGSGVGKSTLVEILTQDCMHDRIDWSGPDDLVSNHIFTRNPGSAYWDGYNGQETLLLDDFMQLVDSPTAPSPEILDTIRIKNTAPFPLPMAELSLKAKSYFRSKLVILTTNQKDFEAKSITYPLALQRRVDIKVLVERPTLPKNALDTDPYVFTLFQDKVKVKQCTYSELVWLIREKLRLREGALDERTELLRQRRLNPVVMTPTSLDATWSRLISKGSETAQEPPMFRDPSPSPPPKRTVEPMLSLDACLKRMTTKNFVEQGSAGDLINGICSGAQAIASRFKRYFDPETEHDETERKLNSIAQIDWYYALLTDISTSPTNVISKVIRWIVDNIEDVIRLTLKMVVKSVIVVAFGMLAKVFVKGIMKIATVAVDTLQNLIFGPPLPEIPEATMKSATTMMAEGKYFFDIVGTPIPALTPEQASDPTVMLEIHTHFAARGLYKRYPTHCFSENWGTVEEWYDSFESRIPRKTLDALLANEDFIKDWNNLFFPESNSPTGKQRSVKRCSVGGKVMRAEGMCDPTADAVIKRISKNMYKLVHNKSHYGILTFITGQVAIANKHVMKEVMREDKITLSDRTGREFTIPKDQVTVYNHSELDLAFVTFPKTVRSHSSIVQYFANAEDLMSEDMLLRGIFIRDGMFERIAGRGQITTRTIAVSPSREGDEEWEVKANQGLVYEGFETVAGDCGTLLSLIDPTSTRKIVAMHTAGSVASGLGFLITHEILEQGLAVIPYTQQAYYDLPTISEENEDYLTKLPAPHEPNTTKLQATKLQEIFPPTKRPSIIRRIGAFDPMDRAVDLLKQPKVQLTQEQFDMVVDVNKHFFYKGKRGLDRRLTIEEAVFGTDEIEPLTLKTSPGYPFMLEHRPHGKAYWIDNINKTIHPELTTLIQERERELRKGSLSTPFIFKDSLKDEKRKFKHTDVNDLSNVKTRVFSASPMDLTILMKMYYGAYFQHITRNKIRNTATVGVNPFGMDWHLLVEYLKEVSNLCDDGDYANFDTSESGSMLLAVLTAANDWYDEPEHRGLREVLARQIAFPVRLARGKLYATDGGLPSGTFGTTHINGGVNLGVFMLAYKHITGHGIGDFADKVRLLTHGDDNIFSVAPSRAEFTTTKIGEFAKTIGFVYTPVAKDETTSVARDITECSFLKRGFVRIGKYWRAPLEKESCIEMMLWITKCKSPTAAMMDNVRTAMSELAITDPQGEIREKVALYLKRNNLYEHLVTSGEQLKIYDDTYF